MQLLTGILTAGTDLSIWVFIGLCATSFLGSFIAAALGLGGGILVIAVMAMTLPPPILIPLHGIVQLGSNFGRTILLYRHVRRSAVLPFAVGTIIGSAVGGNTLIVLPNWVLQAILGLFILYATWSPGFQTTPPGTGKFFGVGIGSGFATMFIGGSGPLIAPFANAACSERQQVVATHAMLMSLQHAFKLVTFSFIGFVFTPYLPLLVGLLIFGFAGTYIGRLVLNRLPEQVFRIGLKSILTLLAARLLYSAGEAVLR